MKKIFLLLAIFVIDVHATDLIDLYDRARQHNINILNNTIYFKGFKNLTIECEFEVDPRYIIKKSDLNIM